MEILAILGGVAIVLLAFAGVVQILNRRREREQKQLEIAAKRSTEAELKMMRPR